MCPKELHASVSKLLSMSSIVHPMIGSISWCFGQALGRNSQGTSGVHLLPTVGCDSFA